MCDVCHIWFIPIHNGQFTLLSVVYVILQLLAHCLDLAPPSTIASATLAA